jgi:hypothetical protein
VDQVSKVSEAGVTVDDAAPTVSRRFRWKSALVTKGAGPAALEHSLAFHRLQEARQELHQARLEIAPLSPRDRARVLAHLEANVASAEQWLARTSESKMMIAPALPRLPVAADTASPGISLRDRSC